MAKKTELPLEVSTRLINHGPVTLLTSAYQDKKNVMTLAWCMPVSHTPRYVAIALPQKRYSYELIEKSKEFVLNMPPIALKQLTLNCGNVSGRVKDKFAEFKIRTAHAFKVKAPLVEECVAHLECVVRSEVKAGDHQIIVGEVVSASANDGTINPEGVVDVKKAQMLHHLGSKYFGVCTKEV